MYEGVRELGILKRSLQHTHMCPLRLFSNCTNYYTFINILLLGILLLASPVIKSLKVQLRSKIFTGFFFVTLSFSKSHLYLLLFIIVSKSVYSFVFELKGGIGFWVSTFVFNIFTELPCLTTIMSGFCNGKIVIPKSDYHSQITRSS